MGTDSAKKIAGDTTILMLSGVFAQLLNLAAYPILTRLYSAADFGVFASLLAVSTLVGGALCLRLDMIFQIVEKAQEATVLKLAFAISGMLVFVLAGILAGVSYLFPSVIHEFYGMGVNSITINFSVLVTGFFIASIALGRQIQSKYQNYRYLSFLQVLRTVSVVVSQLVIYYFLSSFWGLFIGFLIGAIIFSIFSIPASAFLKVDTEAEKPISLLREHRHLMAVDTVNVIVSGSILTLYPLIIIGLFGSEVAGFFAIASRIAFLPVDFLSASISTVYFQRFSKAVRENSGKEEIFRKVILSGLVIGILIALFFGISISTLVGLVFDDEWKPVSGFVLAIVPTMIARFVVGCVSSTPLALKCPKVIFVWNLTQLLLLVSTAFLAEVFDWDAEVFLLVAGGVLCVLSSIYAIYLSKLITIRG